MMKRKRKSVVQRLKEKMGVFPIVLPCFEGIYVYTITPETITTLENTGLSKSVVEWLKNNVNEPFSDETFFDYLEEETSESLSSEHQKVIREALKIENESILVRRLSMLQIMQGKHYPSELTSFIQSVYNQGTQTDEAAAAASEGDSALLFHQWMSCKAAVDPKLFPLHKVVDVLEGRKVNSNWFHYDDFKRLQDIHEKYAKAGKTTFSEADVRNLPEFKDELWNAQDPVDPDREVEVWFVEDIVSDNDLVHISTTAINGPDQEEKPDLKPFRR